MKFVGLSPYFGLGIFWRVRRQNPYPTIPDLTVSGGYQSQQLGWFPFPATTSPVTWTLEIEVAARVTGIHMRRMPPTYENATLSLEIPFPENPQGLGYALQKLLNTWGVLKRFSTS